MGNGRSIALSPESYYHIVVISMNKTPSMCMHVDTDMLRASVIVLTWQIDALAVEIKADGLLISLAEVILHKPLRDRGLMMMVCEQWVVEDD